MRVLFLQDVVNVANAGEIRDVANGFARNYLLPKQLATVATPEETKRTAKLQKLADERRTTETTKWQAVANKVDGATIRLSGKVGPLGQYYGAISVTGIIQELASVTGQEVERRAVELNEPIKEPGAYQVSLRLHQNVSAVVNIVAEIEGQEKNLEEASASATVDDTEEETPETEPEE